MGKTFKDIRRHGREPSSRQLRRAGAAHPSALRCGESRKVCFPSERAALARGAEILRNNPKEADGFRAYRCVNCNQFHLTKHTQRPGIVRSSTEIKTFPIPRFARPKNSVHSVNSVSLP